MYHKKGLWAIKKKNGSKFPTHPKSTAAIALPLTTIVKLPKFYPADDVAKPLINKHKQKLTKLRVSITPGTVLIILAGRFKGRRVVFLKQLVGSGLLLIDDKYFAMEVKKKCEGELCFEEKKEEKDDQKAVDAALLKAIKFVPELKAYLCARFSFKSGMKPHKLVV
ncbi:60S ribosomal protein L6 [Capsicum chinense]|nr:60S ribosomal protein L6 [Capsicum chinense]